MCIKKVVRGSPRPPKFDVCITFMYVQFILHTQMYAVRLLEKIKIVHFCMYNQLYIHNCTTRQGVKHMCVKTEL